MSDNRALTMLCIATYEKGAEFLRACKARGCRVLLLTLDTLAGADWPREAIDDVFYMRAGASPDDFVKGVSYLARSERIDRIVALDDFDVETAALLREHVRLPGMGESTARHFRDKLAMRVRAREAGIPVPDFVHVLNHDRLHDFLERVPPPWVLKPRTQASAVGIRKLQQADDVWRAIDELGDRQSFHLLERFVPGDVFHVDACVWQREVAFAAAHRYGLPPMDVAHQGGIFVTTSLGRETRPSTRRSSMAIATWWRRSGLHRGIVHTEFIRGRDDGRWYFLETAARVGGAHIVDVVEAATGLNLWREWADIEIAGEHGHYDVPPHHERFARPGALARAAAGARHLRLHGPRDRLQSAEALSRRLRGGFRTARAGRSASRSGYAARFRDEFFATAPLPDTPTS